MRGAVIGGGVSGLSCAAALGDHGCEVVVFDRGRGLGGRTATRELGDCIVDHGAPLFTVRDERFDSVVRFWVADGRCAAWEPRWALVRGREMTMGEPKHGFTVPGGMRKLAEHLRVGCGPGVSVRLSATVREIVRTREGWSLRVEPYGGATETISRFDAVVLAMAPGQARRLVASDSALLSGVLRTAETEPVWVAACVLEGATETDATWIEIEGDAALALLVRDDAKPGRTAVDGRSVWVAHAQSEWSASRYDEAPAVVAEVLIERALRVLETGGCESISPERVLHVHAHRWGMARPKGGGLGWSAGEVVCASPERLVVCGDWLGLGDVESAYLSGRKAAAEVLAMLDESQA